MDELMIYEYLKNKSIEDKEFLDKFKTFMESNKQYMRHQKPHFNDGYDMDNYESFKSYNSNSGSFSKDYDTVFRYMRHNKEYSNISEDEAKYLVSCMYHIENNKKYIGEKYDMYKTKEMYQRYRGLLPTHITIPEVYLALNAQYHNYAELFKKWFGDNADSKIIESAIVFWFKDTNYKTHNKVSDYFRE